MKIVYPTDKAAADQIMRQIAGGVPASGTTAGAGRPTAPSAGASTTGGEGRFRNID
jgi:hypothetical protein